MSDDLTHLKTVLCLGERQLLKKVLRLAARDGSCRARQSRLSELTGLGLRTVHRHLRGLVAKGFLRLERGRPNGYSPTADWAEMSTPLPDQTRQSGALQTRQSGALQTRQSGAYGPAAPLGHDLLRCSSAAASAAPQENHKAAAEAEFGKLGLLRFGPVQRLLRESPEQAAAYARWLAWRIAGRHRLRRVNNTRGLVARLIAEPARYEFVRDAGGVWRPTDGPDAAAAPAAVDRRQTAQAQALRQQQEAAEAKARLAAEAERIAWYDALAADVRQRVEARVQTREPLFRGPAGPGSFVFKARCIAIAEGLRARGEL